MNAPFGNPAPDFMAKALHRGEVKKIRLMDYRGRWVLLFFYPRNFTQV